MTMQTVEAHCDTCAESAFLYRLCGTSDALCVRCFLIAYPAPSRRPARGPAAAGCLRSLRAPRRFSGVHRALRLL